MEQEFKWDAFATLQDAVLIWALNRDADHARITEMDAQYFDTPDGALAAEQAALRLRRENETGICCLKLAARLSRGCTRMRNMNAWPPAYQRGSQPCRT